MLHLALAAALAYSASSTRAVLFVKHEDGAAERLLAELALRSDPASPQYLAWLTQAEVRQIL